MPITQPENTIYLAYELIDFESHRKCHPNFFGECLGEFVTATDAKAWLRDHEHYGAFAIVERTNGKIGASWPIEIDPPDDDDCDLDSDLDHAGLELIDPDEYPPEHKFDRRDIELARLKGEIKAQRNGARSGAGELLEAVRLVNEIKQEATPQKTLTEQIREIKEVNELINPPRRENPAPAPQPQRSEEEVLLSTLARNPDVIEKLTGGVFRKLLGSESGHDPEPWYADTVRELVKSGEASKIAGAVIGGFTNLIGNILRPAPVTQPQQTARAPQEPPQIVSGEMPQALPATDQQQSQTDQAGQVAQGTDQASTAPIAAGEDPYVAMLTSVITQLANNGPIEKAVSTVNGFLLINPIYRDTVLDQFEMDAGMLVGAIATIPGCESIPQLPHAKGWIEKFQEQFFGPEDGEDSPDSAGDAEGSVVH